MPKRPPTQTESQTPAQNENEANSLTRGIARKAIGTSQNVANTLIETNRSIWLAGLGALSSLGRTASGSPAFPNFETLVKAGEALEARSKSIVDSSTEAVQKSVNSVTERVDRKLEEFENVFDKRVADTLNRLNIPSRAEVAVLMHRIEVLEAELKALKQDS